MIGATANTMPTTISDTEKRVLDQNVNTYNTQLKETQKIVSKNSLGEADFLTLLVTQLKTQDPTKPMDDKAFIGQMAQFTSLKQMSSVADNLKNFTKEFDFTKSVSLVGKDVAWTDDVGNMHEGKVDSVLMKDGFSYLKINNQTVSLKEITEVRNTEAAVAEPFVAPMIPPAVDEMSLPQKDTKEALLKMVDAKNEEKVISEKTVVETIEEESLLAGE